MKNPGSILKMSLTGLIILTSGSPSALAQPTGPADCATGSPFIAARIPNSSLLKTETISSSFQGKYYVNRQYAVVDGEIWDPGQLAAYDEKRMRGYADWFRDEINAAKASRDFVTGYSRVFEIGANGLVDAQECRSDHDLTEDYKVKSQKLTHKDGIDRLEIVTAGSNLVNRENRSITLEFDHKNPDTIKVTEKNCMHHFGIIPGGCGHPYTEIYGRTY